MTMINPQLPWITDLELFDSPFINVYIDIYIKTSYEKKSILYIFISLLCVFVTEKKNCWTKQWKVIKKNKTIVGIWNR